MRAAIVTLYADNYGNKLQNYALQTIMGSLGYETNTILIENGHRFHRIETMGDYLSRLSPCYLKKAASSRFKNKYPYKNQRDGIIKSMQLSNSDFHIRLRNKLLNKRREAFRLFSKQHLHLESRVLKPGDYQYADEYDVYICGSDQIWNPTYNSFSSPFFLSFVPEYKRVAYAPSFGLSTLPEELKPLYRRWLNGIPYLSVREEEGARLIRNLTGKRVPVLPDPALCLSASEWEAIEKKPSLKKTLLKESLPRNPLQKEPLQGEKAYILTYFLGNETDLYRRFIEKYAIQTGAEIINLNDIREPDHYAAGPAEFVWLVHHAKAVFTDSYHGIIFSLIFHTPFVVFKRIESGGEGMNSRINTLLKLSGMENRRFETLSLESIGSVDFKDADAAVQKKVREARLFLMHALRKMNDEASEANLEKTKVSETVRPDRSDCSGCSACSQICPVECIRMENDAEGFLYPVIDTSKCINCDRCRDICVRAQSHLTERNVTSEKSYLAYSRDDDIRRGSSSGGLFSMIAETVLSKGGLVCGAGFDRDFKVRHMFVSALADLPGLRGSKYVQSETGNSYKRIREELERGRLILFSGTPCQVDGLLACLGKEYENLYTQDILCHGVPSPAVWKEYLLMRSGGELVKDVSFRDKTYGWHYFSMKIETDKRKYVRRLDEDTYLRLFLDDVILRPSCYACHHKSIHHKADFTLGDCWGKTDGLKDDDRGISLLFVNSDKGQKLIGELENDVLFYEIPFEDAVLKQKVMTESVPYNQNRELFFSMAEELGIREALEKWYSPDPVSFLKTRKGYAKYVIARELKKIRAKKAADSRLANKS